MILIRQCRTNRRKSGSPVAVYYPKLFKPGQDFAVPDIGDQAIGRVRTVDPDKPGFGVHHQSVILKRGKLVGRILLDYAISYSDDEARAEVLDLSHKFDDHFVAVATP